MAERERVGLGLIGLGRILGMGIGVGFVFLGGVEG